MTIHAGVAEAERSATTALRELADLRDGRDDVLGPVTSPAKTGSETSRSTLLRHGKRLAWIGAALAVGIAIAGFGRHYWTVGRFQVSTDDAYVQADNTTIAPKVAGYIEEVLVADNEAVDAGHVLARIDDRDYRVALDQANAGVDQARSALASSQVALENQQSAIEAARAALALDNANRTFAEQENSRFADLASTGSGTVRNAQQAASRLGVETAALQRDTATLASAIKQVDVLKAAIAQANATLEASLAAKRQAELNLGYTTIRAPIAGVVGNRTLRAGQYVQAGTQLMSVVPTADAYIVANFKETQLTYVEPGQAVDVEVDTFPGIVAHGRVDSIAPASGQQFALLPPDNATGNFTKIVQRIPVKIVLDPVNPLSGRLRPGMSVAPTIDTKAAATRSASNGANSRRQPS